MIKKDNHLKKIRDFNLVIKKGFWLNGSFFSLKMLDLAKNENLIPKKENPEKWIKQLKLAVNIGLKVSKKAVIRNRLKRQTMAVLRDFEKKIGFKSGFYLLFIAKPDIKDKNFAEISEEVRLLLARAKVLVL